MSTVVLRIMLQAKQRLLVYTSMQRFTNHDD